MPNLVGAQLRHLNALYGYGYLPDLGTDSDWSPTTADILAKQNALYAGPGGALRSMRDAIPPNEDLPPSQFFMDPRAMSARNMLRGGLGTAANWLQGTPATGDMLAPLGLAPMGMALTPRNAVGVFGGKLANTADHAALARAQEMTAKGVGRDDVWRETGWGVGPDGKWRFEIDDSGATLNSAAESQKKTVSDILAKHGLGDAAGPRDTAAAAALPERPVAAAVRLPNGKVYTGALHSDAVEAAMKAGEDIDFDRFMAMPNAMEADGFVTNTGRYVTRHEGTDLIKNADPSVRMTAGILDARSLPLDSSTRQQAKASGAEPSITAYHGSPHDFDRFDMSRIGTGEGAQAYGHGLYFAENEATAKSYRDALIPTGDALAGVKAADGKPTGYHNIDVMLAKLYGGDWEAFKRGQSGITKELDAAIADIDSRGGVSYKPASGKMYEVRINADPESFLDWDKPLSQQGEAVREHLSAMKKRLEDYGAHPIKDTIADLSMAYNKRSTGYEGEFEQSLRQKGIPGIKYLDQGSRTPKILFDDQPVVKGAKGNWAVQSAAESLDLHGTPEKAIEALSGQTRGYGGDAAREAIELLRSGRVAKHQPEGTRNFVIFDAQIVDILKKYGLAGAIGAGAMSQDNQQ